METKIIAFWTTQAIVFAIAVILLSTVEIIVDINIIKYTISIMLISIVALNFYNEIENINKSKNKHH